MANKTGFKMLSEKQKYVTGRVILQYCNFKKPYSFNENDDPKYSATILLKKDEDKEEIENLKKIISMLWKEGKLSNKSMNPLKDGDEKAKEMEMEEKDGSFYKDYYIFKSNSKFPIKVVDGKKLAYVDEDSTCQGRYCRLNLEFYAYKAGINSGVTSYLKAVQILHPSGLEFNSSGVDDFDEEPDADMEKGDDLPF